jgi:two-component system, chemotaxis family, sensor kinase CheA
MNAKGLEKLRMLFAQEAEQRLGRLGQLVMDLEESTLDDVADLIGEIFREVHTLKGSAAVVGFETVGRYAHEVEERLGQLRSGTVSPTRAIVDALLVATDRLGLMIWQAVDGDESGDDGSESLARLAAAFDGDDRQPDGPAIEPTVLAPEPTVLAPEPTVLPPGSAVLRSEPAEKAPSPVVAKAQRPAGAREHSGTVMVPIERLDELVRMVGEAAAAHLRVGRVLTEQTGLEPGSLTEFSELSRVLNQLQEGAMRTRMVPVSTITDQLQRAVRDAARSLGKDVRWEVRGESTELDRGVLHQLSDALLHLARNAVDHGIESAAEREAAGKPAQATVRLHAMQLGSEVIIAITDDGGGIDLDRVRDKATRLGIETDGLTDDDVLHLIFRSGFSTASFVSDISGRGVGLDAVRASVQAARGRVEIRSTPGVGSEFRIVVPITLAVLRCLLVEAGAQRFALPLHRVALARAEGSAEELHAEGRRMIAVDGLPVPVSDLAEVLGGTPARAGSGTFVVVNGTVGRHAFLVDELVGQRDVVVKGLSALVPRLDVVAGASVEPDGSILIVLDPPGLIERSRRTGARSLDDVPIATQPVRRTGRLLVVDDALTVRELQRTILERAGFEVRVACDGIEALEMIEDDLPDLVLTDVEMPRMDGFTLTEQIRARPGSANVAVLILTSLATDADRRRGMDAGADGYIVKSSFDEHSLLAAVDRLLGVPA